ncbi:hypothetical protein ABZ695_16890 [Streptomyces sp. NPDC006976]
MPETTTPAPRDDSPFDPGTKPGTRLIDGSYGGRVTKRYLIELGVSRRR